MSLNRLLSRRDKLRLRRDQPFTSNTHFNGSFKEKEPVTAEQDDQKVKDIQSRLCEQQAGTFTDDDINYALRLPFTGADVPRTVEFLKFLQDSQDLIVTSYDPTKKFLGAINRNNVTCYLDSLLFAMFGCQDSYEPMLVNRFGDPKKDRLATLLRLWVNLQRAGKLITTDIMRQIQDALADLGWAEAAETKQQDSGEAFTFITEQLGLPNLYLKMDLFHHGKEDAKDDHKIVQERLLEMPIPDPSEGRTTITLEDCAEEALNAKVEVRRFLEGIQRRDTAGSIRSQKSYEFSKGNAVQVEATEVNGSEPSTPSPARTQSPFPHEHSKKPLTLQHRTPSIIQESVVQNNVNDSERGSDSRARAGSIRKEVMIPAWQMYSLIPFHTDYSPENDAQVAHHFRLKRPIFGIRLKRYGLNKDGKPTRKETYIDIPVDMAFPSFIHDESTDKDSASFGKFKLALQSAVCHRGKSTESGHYVCLARGRNANGLDRWFLFDDLALKNRVREVDVSETLKTETPYILFYQVQPIEDFDSSRQPGSTTSIGQDSGVAGVSSTPSSDLRQGSDKSSGRISPDDTFPSEGPRGRASDVGEIRPSIAPIESSQVNSESFQQKGHQASKSLTVDTNAVPSRRSSKFSKSGSRSRPTSSKEHRHSSSLNRLTGISSEAVDRILSNYSQNQPSKPAANTMAEVVIAAQEKEKEKQKKKDEKSRNRLSTHGAFIRSINSKVPDRECILM